MDKPDFASSYSKANEILVISNIISGFPYSALDLVKEQSEIKCRTFKKALEYGVDISTFGSESAVIFEYGGKSIIFYDDEKPMSHVKFSIIHELGHFVNEHKFSKKDSKIYGKYEVETNYFAAQLLMPEQLLREIQNRGMRITHQFLQEHFGVSHQAADKRKKTLAKTNIEWRSRMEQEYDDIIILKYAAFLDKICPVKNEYDFEDEYNRQLERNSWC
ncbi:MAG: ImmA/IrrE family metallo-endopeptidase [Firmicutes bacterium]|nr:ImmA/IrrE family metallo-endopeptidase [Bacillota bacterium]